MFHIHFKDRSVVTVSEAQANAVRRILGSHKKFVLNGTTYHTNDISDITEDNLPMFEGAGFKKFTAMKRRLHERSLQRQAAALNNNSHRKEINEEVV